MHDPSIAVIASLRAVLDAAVVPHREHVGLPFVGVDEILFERMLEEFIK